MAVAQKENTMLCGLRGTMAVWHTGGSNVAESEDREAPKHRLEPSTLQPLLAIGQTVAELGQEQTDLSMSFILASPVTLKKVNFCAARGYGSLPVEALKGLQQVLFIPWFLSGISLLAHKPSVQKHQTPSATPPCIFYLIPNMENHSAKPQCPHRRWGSPAEINSIGTHEKSTVLDPWGSHDPAHAAIAPVPKDNHGQVTPCHSLPTHFSKWSSVSLHPQLPHHPKQGRENVLSPHRVTAMN